MDYGITGFVSGCLEWTLRFFHTRYTLHCYLFWNRRVLKISCSRKISRVQQVFFWFFIKIGLSEAFFLDNEQIVFFTWKRNIVESRRYDCFYLRRIVCLMLNEFSGNCNTTILFTKFAFNLNHRAVKICFYKFICPDLQIYVWIIRNRVWRVLLWKQVKNCALRIVNCEQSKTKVELLSYSSKN